MRNQMKNLIALLAIILCLNGCKKNDYITNPNAVTEKEIIEKYTKVPKGLNPILQKIADKLKEKDAQNSFIVKVGSKAGMPLWNKAQFKSKNTNNTAAREIGEGEEMVLIPLSVPNSNEVDGFIASIINGDKDVVEVSEHDKFNYYVLGFNRPNNERDAEDIAMQCLVLQQEVFGNAMLKILDSRLFNSEDANPELRKVYEISLSETQPTSPTSSKVIVVKSNHCVHHSSDIIGPNGHEGGDCDECDWCGLFDYTIVFFDSPFDWGSGGGIGGGQGIGGGVGGAGWIPPPPPVLTVSNIWQNFGGTTLHQAFINNINNKPILDKLAQLMAAENFSEESKNATKAVMDADFHNEINGPYNQQHFLDIISDLPTKAVVAGQAVYWETFIHEQLVINAANPGMSDYEVYCQQQFKVLN